MVIRKINPDEYIGKQFGRLIVIGVDYEKSKLKQKTHFICECTCKPLERNTKSVLSSNLKNGHTQSCGCVQKEVTRTRSITHGKSTDRLYRILVGMKDRCCNENYPKYPSYGGRGIKICDEWLDDFMKFHSWAIENGYNEKLTIERINVNGNYEPSNCKWITMEEQARNKRDSTIVEYEGEKYHLLDLLEKLGKVDEYRKISHGILKNNYNLETLLELPDGKFNQGVYFFKKYINNKFQEINKGVKVTKNEICKEANISIVTFRRYLKHKEIVDTINNLNITIDKHFLIKNN